jgi:hypothetical protein
MWDAEQERFVGHDVVVLTLEGARIAEMTAFMASGTVEGFGLPAAIV